MGDAKLRKIWDEFYRIVHSKADEKLEPCRSAWRGTYIHLKCRLGSLERGKVLRPIGSAESGVIAMDDNTLFMTSLTRRRR